MGPGVLTSERQDDVVSPWSSLLDPRRGSGALEYMKASMSTYSKMKSTKVRKYLHTTIRDVTHRELNVSGAATDIGLVKDDEGRRM